MKEFLMNKKIILLLVLLIGCASDKKMKHPLDKSIVKKIILPNKLRVYLLSDPDLNISSASLSVRTGSLDNPETRMGLAHFIEHMFKMGTKKYPDLDAFNTYLSSNGGSYNAYTSRDHTNYHFQIFPHAMEGALDRFSDRFINPLFPEEYVTKEVNAVHSEHQKNIMNDNWRLFRISTFLSKEGHPARKFQTGNLETLGDIKREEVVSFFEERYSANQMALSVLSTQPLEEIEFWVRKYFSSMPNRELGRPTYPSDVYEVKKTFRVVNIEPVKDIREMSMMFPLKNLRREYKSKPGRLLGYILGNEGEGSLLSHLKNKGWATSLSAGTNSETDSYGGARITIGLTPDGLENYKNIIKSTLSYISIMKKEGYRSSLFSELKKMAELDEIYSNKGEGTGRAIALANEVLFYPLEDAGRTRYLYTENNGDVYERVLADLVPENMMVYLVAKELETDTKEHFYNAPYSYIEDDDFFKELTNLSSDIELIMKKENPFIPKNASIPNRAFGESIPPELIMENTGEKVFYGQDSEFLRPKGVLTYKIFFPKTKMNPEFRAKLKIYVATVNESLNEFAYPAKEAGLNYSIRDGYEGVYVTVSGYRESSIALLSTIVKHLKTPEISNDKFVGIKDKIVRGYKNFYLSDAWQIVRDQTERLFMKTYYRPSNLYSAAKTIVHNDIINFASSLYDETYIEGLVYGDYEKEEAERSLEIVKSGLKTKGVTKEEVFEMEFLSHERNEKIQVTQKMDVNNSCFWREYYFGDDLPKIRAISRIINQAIQRPFFTEMRTNQQLGYIVWSGSQRREDSQYLYFIIQSGVYSADELNLRANKYINTLPSVIASLDPEMFEKYRQAAIDILEKKPKSIYERAMKNKDLVFEFDADFNRNKNTIQALKEIDQKTVAEVLRSSLDTNSMMMINSLGFAKDHPNKSGLSSSYNNLSAWKSSRTYQ
tara:strand:+ start:3110 stop:5935 length:2826 start_codon:yes stop_codon:yes gene_type:complete